jgi:hypothetical protein
MKNARQAAGHLFFMPPYLLGGGGGGDPGGGGGIPASGARTAREVDVGEEVMPPGTGTRCPFEYMHWI